MVALVSIHLKQELNQVRAAYGGSVSLGLPGAKDVRVSPQEAANYQAVVAAIDQNCGSFVMLPGMSSFYFWTQQESPPGYNPTDWTIVFDDARQQRVIEAIRSIDRLCLLENVPLTNFWGDGAKIWRGPLVRYRTMASCRSQSLATTSFSDAKGAASAGARRECAAAPKGEVPVAEIAQQRGAPHDDCLRRDAVHAQLNQHRQGDGRLMPSR